MERRESIFFYIRSVCDSSVSFVLGKSVLFITISCLLHSLISFYFGDNRCCSYQGIFLITLDDSDDCSIKGFFQTKRMITVSEESAKNDAKLRYLTYLLHEVGSSFFALHQTI